ncbi:MAG TPA: HipA family kinase [Candidatus Limnocylindrales bacterium]|nr:HipA family kinase [Candidatus Limnocylindrales bacterium]
MHPDASPIALRTVRATKYVTPFREGGSLPGLVEADDDGLYVVKFRGAAQGPKALVAELIAGELGRAIGLPVPELVLVDIDPSLGGLDGDPWVGELLEKSPGINLGLDFLPGSLSFNARADGPPDAAFAADVVWFDALVTNTDRSPRNPNLLAWHRRLFLIDHGAALFIHHTWRDADAHARRPLTTIGDHVMLPAAGSLADAHERMAQRVTEPLLREIVAAVPDAWLSLPAAVGDPDAQRDAYVRYLLTRVGTRAVLVDAIEGVRLAANRAA